MAPSWSLISSSSAMPDTHSLVIALIVVVGTGLPALVYTIWRGRKTGPKEEEELVARMAKEAVEAANTMLTAAREERVSLVERVRHLEEEVTRLSGENTSLRAEVNRLRRTVADEGPMA